ISQMAVTLTSPDPGPAYTTPATIHLNATVNGSAGTISRVSFFAGTTWIGTARSEPFTFTWRNVPPGSYDLTAVATDSLGAIATSNVLRVTATADNRAAYVGTDTTTQGTWLGVYGTQGY